MTTPKAPYTKFWLRWITCAALCISTSYVNAAEPADSTPSPIAALDELLAPPLLKARAESADQPPELFKPSSNTMTKAVRRASQQSGREIAYDMPIDYRDGRIYNP